MKNYLFIVEGNHDVAYLGKVLRLIGYSGVKILDDLHPIMQKLVPSRFPFLGDRLEIFNIVPYFFKKDTKQIAIINANGETNILAKLDEKISELKIEEAINLNHIFIFADGDLSDRQKKLEQILNVDFEELELNSLKKDDLMNENPKINLIEGHSIDLKYYIFPNNDAAGRLENVMLKAIKLENEDLLVNTNEMLEKIDPKYKTDWKNTNSNKEKTIIGIIGNILIPGSSNTTSISHKEVRWISKKTTAEVEEIRDIYDFLNQYL